MEFGSGEDCLRPQFYFFEYSFLEYALANTLKYEMPLAPIVGQRGDGDVGASPR